MPQPLGFFGGVTGAYNPEHRREPHFHERISPVTAARGAKHETTPMGLEASSVIQTRNVSRLLRHGSAFPRSDPIESGADAPPRRLQIISCLGAQPVAIAQAEEPA